MVRLLTAMALPLLLPLAVISLDQPILDEPIPAVQRLSGKPSELHWGGRTFTSQREFANWLSARGASYEVWAERHPGAVSWQAETSARAARFRDALAAWGIASLLAFALIAPWRRLVERAGGGWYAGRPVTVPLVLAAVAGGALVPLAFLLASRA